MSEVLQVLIVFGVTLTCGIIGSVLGALWFTRKGREQ